MDYEKILESLKVCSEVGTSCEGCSGRGERHCIANLTKTAAIAIETLLHELGMARRERDVMTKRMTELEQETVTNRNGLNEPLTLDELRKMDGEPVWIKLFDPDEGFWVLRNEWVDTRNPEPMILFHMRWYSHVDYGKTWLAYRQQPAEEADHYERKENEHV